MTKNNKTINIINSFRDLFQTRKGVLFMEIRRMSRANMATLTGFIFSLFTVIFFLLAEIFEEYIIFWSLAIITFMISMAFDMIDGYFARKDGTAGDIGGTIDHMRDKMSMLMLYSPLLALGLIHWLFLLLIFFREFFVIMIRLIFLLKRQAKPNHSLGVSAKSWGKIKTISQTIAGLVFALALFNYSKEINLKVLSQYFLPYQENYWWQVIHYTLQIIIALISISSGILYGIMYKDYIHEAFMDIKEKENLQKK